RPEFALGGVLGGLMIGYDIKGGRTHFHLQGVDYECEFRKNANGQLEFLVDALRGEGGLSMDLDCLRETGVKDSNYIARRKFDANGKRVYGKCRVKRVPENPDEINDNQLYHDTFKYMVREIVRVVRKKSDSE
ncbi:unnamed protein product, partial [marine sediment metagenome]